MSRYGTQLAPSRRIRSYTVSNPFKELFEMQRNLNNLFEGKTTNEETALNAWTPVVDIYEDQDAFLLKLELPEVRKCSLYQWRKTFRE
jgi:HSP20 family molecular chaperone IbpA